MNPTTVAQTLASYARPARPVTPTPTSQDDIMEALYGPGSQAPPAPLPDWVPPNVQNYINTQPSYAEGQRQTLQPPSITRGDEPYDQTPQIGDIQRLFQNSIRRNAPISNYMRGPALKKVIQSGYMAGGDDI